MANAKKCDICGKFYQEYEPNFLESFGYLMQQSLLSSHVRENMHKINCVLDLCSGCEKTIENMMVEMENEDGRNNASAE